MVFIFFFVPTHMYTALELQPSDWLTMYYCGEVLGRQRKMEESKDMFKLAAETEILAIH